MTSHAASQAKAAGTHRMEAQGPIPDRLSRGAFRQRSILHALDEPRRRLLLGRCEQLHFRRGEILYSEGSRHKATFLIARGLVRSYHTSSRGKELTIGYWSDGDIIGGPHWFDDTRIHIWSARAVEDTEAYAVSGRDLKELALRIPEIGDAVLDALSFKCYWDSLLMQMLATRSVTARLADLLVKLAALHGEESSHGIAISRRFSQDDLASMVGATRQWINAKLVEFETHGLVKTRGNRLVIPNLARLKSVVN
jgi:CRP-like cAMP-binding protein